MQARLWECHLHAYPCRNRGNYAVHLRMCFGITSTLPFSTIAYTQDVQCTYSIPGHVRQTAFDDCRLWEEPEYAVDGRHVAVGIHAVSYLREHISEASLTRVRMQLILFHP
jgi:hypothetical protein